jgi:uncharacterized membrane protein
LRTTLQSDIFPATMPNEPVSSNIPQFGKAEYSTKQQDGRCAICQQPLGSLYYRVKQAIACEACALKAKLETPSDSHSAFVGALLFGIGGAILGLIAYSLFTIATGIEIGFVSLAVGYLVGKAMKRGSKGSGGRRYQIAAVLLTYAAVSLSAIPIGIAQYAKEARAHQTSAVASPSAPQSSESSPTADQSAPAASSSDGQHSFGSVLGSLILLGLASPFLELQQDPANAAIGLLILFVGMQFAWRLTAGTELGAIMGPFANRSATAAPPAPL